MKRIIIIISLISLSVLTNFSCSKGDDSNSAKKEPADCIECKSKEHKVELSAPITISNQKDSLLLAIYKSSGYTKLNKTKFGKVEGKMVQVSDIIGHDGKVIYIELNKSDKSSKWLIAMMFPDRIELFIHELSIGKDTFTLNEYNMDGTLFLSGLANKSDGKFISVTGNNLKSTEVTWNYCMKTAYNACQADWQCSIMCGLMFPSCIGSMAVACAITAATN